MTTTPPSLLPADTLQVAGSSPLFCDTALAVRIERGCDVAVVTTQPGSKSQQNTQRAGFDLLYTRAILVKKAGCRP